MQPSVSGWGQPCLSVKWTCGHTGLDEAGICLKPSGWAHSHGAASAVEFKGTRQAGRTNVTRFSCPKGPRARGGDEGSCGTVPMETVSDGFPGAGTDPGQGPILKDGAWENPSRGRGHRVSSGDKDSVL